MPEPNDSPTDPLASAVTVGDLEAVRRLLAEGASLLSTDGRDSVLRLAHRKHEASAQGPAIVSLIRQAARDAAARSRSVGLAAGALDRWLSPARDRGARDLRRSVDATRHLDVLLAECEVKDAARSLDQLVASPRREADVGARRVEDAARAIFLYRLRGLSWTVIPCVFDAASDWAVASVPELAARGDGVGPLARALASAAGCRVVHLQYDALTIHAPSGAIDRRAFAPEEWWAPEGALPSPEEAAAILPGFAGDPGELPAAAAHRLELLRRMDGWLAELGALVPPMRVATDGIGVRLELGGVAPEDVERVDLVVLQEHGAPAVDRRPGQAPAAPAMIAPDGTPVLAHAPPAAVVAPDPAQPALRSEPARAEPPPVVAPAPPPPASAPPPPLVTPGDVKPNAPPPMVTREPASGAPPPPMVEEPDPSRGPSAPPPMVTREPSSDD